MNSAKCVLGEPRTSPIKGGAPRVGSPALKANPPPPPKQLPESQSSNFQEKAGRIPEYLTSVQDEPMVAGYQWNISLS